MARPTDYTPELAERICEWIAEGNSLRSFCVQDEEPHVSTVTRWIVKHPEFRAQYVDAREAAGYAHADNIVDIVRRMIEEGLEPNAARVMMDGLKWSAERMAPKSHMPQSLVNHQSPDGSMTPKPAMDLTKLSDETLKELIAIRDAAQKD